MVLSLESFLAAEGSRKCLVLGDMLELGSDSHREHLKIVERVEKMNAEKVFWVGPLFTRAAREKGAAGMCFPHVDALITYLEKETPEGLVILIKGSNGIRLTKLIAPSFWKVSFCLTQRNATLYSPVHDADEIRFLFPVNAT
jgi:UDP-N-acetylmuramoyl-tripeptide--D-alanyl-D-alanine ligase